MDRYTDRQTCDSEGSRQTNMWKTVSVADRQRRDSGCSTQRHRQADRNKGEAVIRADKDGARAAVWQRVCTAEHKLKKPRPLSHTPLGPKLHGVLHSTHKQPPGKAPGRMGEAGGRQAGRRETTTAFSHQHNASKLQRDCRDKRWRQRGLARDQRLFKVSSAKISQANTEIR